MTTAEQLSQRYDTDIRRWGEHPEYPMSEWRDEVANGDTRRGYWDWVASQIEARADGEDPAPLPDGQVRYLARKTRDASRYYEADIVASDPAAALAMAKAGECEWEDAGGGVFDDCIIEIFAADGADYDEILATDA